MLKRLIGSLAVPSPPVSGQLPEKRHQIVELGRIVRRDPRACFEAGHPQAYFDRPEPHVRAADDVRGADDILEVQALCGPTDTCFFHRGHPGPAEYPDARLSERHGY